MPKKLNKRIFMLSEINQALAAVVIEQLLEFGSDPQQPIELYINSEGGTVVEALAIADTIAAIQAPVIGIVVGTCYSAAVVVLQACSTRLMTQHSTLMMHEGTCSTGRVPRRELKASFKLEYDTLERFCNDLIMKRAKMSKSVFKRLNSRGAYLTAPEAKKLGLVDEIQGGSDN